LLGRHIFSNICLIVVSQGRLKVKATERSWS